MRAVWCGLCFLACASPAHPDALPDVLAAAWSASPSAVSLDIDRELAELRVEKSRIEAKRERDKLSAEATYLAALESQRKSLQDFCDDAVNALFDAAVAEVGVRIAAVTEATANEEQLAAEAQYERGLLSEESRTNARLAYRSARLSLDQATWAFEDARYRFETTTGLEWRASLVPEAPDLVVPEESESWTENDLGLRRAEIAERLAALDVASLPGNASPYDKRIADAALRKAEIALEQSRRSSERSFRSAAQTLVSRRAAIALRADEMALQQALLADAERRYARGAIPRTDRDQQGIRVLNAEKARLEAVRSCLRSIVAYLVSTGADPRGTR